MKIETYSYPALIVYKKGFPIKQYCAEILDHNGNNLFPYNYFWSDIPIGAIQKAIDKFNSLEIDNGNMGSMGINELREKNDKPMESLKEKPDYKRHVSEKISFVAMTVEYFNIASGDTITGYEAAKCLQKLWNDKVTPLQKELTLAKEERDKALELVDVFKKAIILSDHMSLNLAWDEEPTERMKFTKQIDELKEEIERLKQELGK